MKQFLLLLIALTSISLFSLTCKDAGVQPDKTFALTVDDVSCTEVYLKLAVSTNISDRTVTLKRDGVELWTRSIDASETLVTDTNLLPGHTYTYTANLISPPPFWMDNNSTAQLQVQTLDTTSSNFTWTVETLGDGSSSTLYDVAIVNDTLAYACGEIYSGGSICNLARWNGQQWDTMRISVTLTYTSSQIVTDQDPLKTIYAFNENDIWVVSSAGGVSHWNGTQWVMLSIPFNQGPGGCNKMWGTSSSNLYFVGNNGRIIYCDGSTWTKLESGTTLPIQDIWGAIDPHSGMQQILAIASNRYLNEGKKILSISTTGVTALGDSGLSWSLNSIWFVPNRIYYVCGDGIYPSHSLSGRWQRDTGFPFLHKNRVRGTSVNDVVVVGVYGLFSHFNGVTWQHFTGYVPNYENMSFESVDLKNNLVVAAGQLQGSQAVIVMGRRP